MLVDETKPDTLAGRAQARQALADAINAVAVARESLAAAQAAVEAGWSRMIDAGNRLEALKARLPQLSAAPPTDAVLAALSSMQVQTRMRRSPEHELLGVAPEARSPRALAEDEIAALEESRAQLRRSIEIAEREVEARKLAVENARRRAHRAAVEVVKVSGASERLLHGLADLQAEVTRRRVALRFLAASGAITPGDEEKVESLLSVGRELPGLPTQGSGVDWRTHPTHGEWWNALAALEHDPDSRLPG